MAILLGAGTTLGVLSGGSYVAIANVVSIGGPDITVADVDVTVLLSPNLWKQYIPGFKEGGTIQMECRYDHLQFAALFNSLGSAQNYQILFTDGSKFQCPGYLNALSTNIPLEEDVGSPFTLKVSGQPTFNS
jgi:hypothetical protein